MKDIVLDTNLLSDLVSQIQFNNYKKKIVLNKYFTNDIDRIINKIVDCDGDNGLIVASTFAIIEVINKFNQVSKGLFDQEKLITFIQQPPAWFVLEPLDEITSKELLKVPKTNKQNQRIELTDAIHVATTFQRGPGSILATTDQKLHNLELNEIEIFK